MVSPALLEVGHSYYKTYQPKTCLLKGIRAAITVAAVLIKLYKRLSKKRELRKKQHICPPAQLCYPLMEGSTNLSIIQPMPDHNNIKTALRYTHKTQRQIVTIQSPLDKLHL